MKRASIVLAGAFASICGISAAEADTMTYYKIVEGNNIGIAAIKESSCNKAGAAFSATGNAVVTAFCAGVNTQTCRGENQCDIDYSPERLYECKQGKCAPVAQPN